MTPRVGSRAAGRWGPHSGAHGPGYSPGACWRRGYPWRAAPPQGRPGITSRTWFTSPPACRSSPTTTSRSSTPTATTGGTPAAFGTGPLTTGAAGPTRLPRGPSCPSTARTGTGTTGRMDGRLGITAPRPRRSSGADHRPARRDTGPDRGSGPRLAGARRDTDPGRGSGPRPAGAGLRECRRVAAGPRRCRRVAPDLPRWRPAGPARSRWRRGAPARSRCVPIPGLVTAAAHNRRDPAFPSWAAAARIGSRPGYQGSCSPLACQNVPVFSRFSPSMRSINMRAASAGSTLPLPPVMSVRT